MKLKYLLKFFIIFPFFYSLNLYANEPKSNTEKLGDLFLILLPSTAYASTYIKDDIQGRDEFYKSFLVNGGITYSLKSTVDAERPDKSGNDSFPSGHTSVTFQSAVFIHKRYGLKNAILPYIAASFTGWSRVDAQKHHTRDVLAGGLIGACSSLYFTSSYQNLALLPIIEKDNIGMQLTYKW